MRLAELRDAAATTDSAELILRAKALRDLLAGNAADGESARRIPEESMSALTEAGLLRLTVPRRFGGYEVDLRTKVEVAAAVSEADGSAGWIVTLINVCNWAASLYCDRAQHRTSAARRHSKGLAHAFSLQVGG